MRTFGCWVTLGKIGMRVYIIQEIVCVVWRCSGAPPAPLCYTKDVSKSQHHRSKLKFLARFLVGLFLKKHTLVIIRIFQKMEMVGLTVSYTRRP